MHPLNCPAPRSLYPAAVALPPTSTPVVSAMARVADAPKLNVQAVTPRQTPTDYGVPVTILALAGALAGAGAIAMFFGAWPVAIPFFAIAVVAFIGGTVWHLCRRADKQAASTGSNTEMTLQNDSVAASEKRDMSGAPGGRAPASSATLAALAAPRDTQERRFGAQDREAMCAAVDTLQHLVSPIGEPETAQAPRAGIEDRVSRIPQLERCTTIPPETKEPQPEPQAMGSGSYHAEAVQASEEQAPRAAAQTLADTVNGLNASPQGEPSTAAPRETRERRCEAEAAGAMLQDFAKINTMAEQVEQPRRREEERPSVLDAAQRIQVKNDVAKVASALNERTPAENTPPVGASSVLQSVATAPPVEPRSGDDSTAVAPRHGDGARTRHKQVNALLGPKHQASRPQVDAKHADDQDMTDTQQKAASAVAWVKKIAASRPEVRQGDQSHSEVAAQQNNHNRELADTQQKAASALAWVKKIAASRPEGHQTQKASRVSAEQSTMGSSAKQATPEYQPPMLRLGRSTSEQITARRRQVPVVDFIGDEVSQQEAQMVNFLADNIERRDQGGRRNLDSMLFD